MVARNAALFGACIPGLLCAASASPLNTRIIRRRQHATLRIPAATATLYGGIRFRGGHH